MGTPDLPRPYMGLRSGMIGIEAEGLEGQLAQYFGVKEGVLVRAVLKGSPAEKAGLKAGDVIIKADATGVESPKDLTNAVRSRGNKKSVPLTLMREKKEMSLVVTFEEEQGQNERRGPARRVSRQEEEFRF
jgi:serine protease Do